MVASAVFLGAVASWTSAAAASPKNVEPLELPGSELPPGSQRPQDSDRSDIRSSLLPGEWLPRGRSLTSPNGRYRLTLQSNGNLVLYDTAGFAARPPASAPAGWTADVGIAAGHMPLALWDARTAGAPGSMLVMRSDGDLVMKSDGALVVQVGGDLVMKSDGALVVQVGGDLVMQSDGALVVQVDGDSGAPIWHTRTADRPGAFLSVRDDGSVTIGYSDGRVLWTAGTSMPDVGLAGTKHVVYDRGNQRMWLIEADGSLFDTYPVSGRATSPSPGAYGVFSKSQYSSSPRTPVTMRHMVRFVKATTGLAIGFHSIPQTYAGTPIQTVDELGQPRSAGCVRQDSAKARQLYEWAPIGTPVTVIA